MPRRTEALSGRYRLRRPSRRKEILAAYEKAKADGFLGTDDASVAEHSGFPVRVIMGSYRNIKITTKEDLLIGAAFLKEETE